MMESDEENDVSEQVTKVEEAQSSAIETDLYAAKMIESSQITISPRLGNRILAYDERKSAYTAGTLPFDSKDFVVNLDNECSREFKFSIKFDSLHHLQQYLNGRQHDAQQETIQILDVVLSEKPSNIYENVVRSFLRTSKITGLTEPAHRLMFTPFLAAIQAGTDVKPPYLPMEITISPSKRVRREILKKASRLGNHLKAYDGRKSACTAGPLPFVSKDFVVKLDNEVSSYETAGRSFLRTSKIAWLTTEPAHQLMEFKVSIKFASKADLHHLQQYLYGRQHDAQQETIHILDVVLQEKPSNIYERFTLKATGEKMSVVEYYVQTYTIVLKYLFLPAIQADTDAKPTYLPLEAVADNILTTLGLRSMLGPRYNNRIAKACGAVIVNRPDELQESDAGTSAGLFEVKKIGDKFFSFIVEFKEPKACTVLLKGASKDLLNKVERNLQDAMAVARIIIKTPKLVPGGGATELTVSAMLKQKSSSIEGVEKWPYEAAAVAFEAVPRTLAQNCGDNVIRTMTALQGKHDGRKSAYTAGPLPFVSKDFVVKLDNEVSSYETVGRSFLRTSKFAWLTTEPAHQLMRNREFKVSIKFASKPDLHHLQQYLNGRQHDAQQETIHIIDVITGKEKDASPPGKTLSSSSSSEEYTEVYCNRIKRIQLPPPRIQLPIPSDSEDSDDSDSGGSSSGLDDESSTEAYSDDDYEEGREISVSLYNPERLLLYYAPNFRKCRFDSSDSVLDLLIALLRTLGIQIALILDEFAHPPVAIRQNFLDWYYFSPPPYAESPLSIIRPLPVPADPLDLPLPITQYVIGYTNVRFFYQVKDRPDILSLDDVDTVEYEEFASSLEHIYLLVW